MKAQGLAERVISAHRSGARTSVWEELFYDLVALQRTPCPDGELTRLLARPGALASLVTFALSAAIDSETRRALENASGATSSWEDRPWFAVRRLGGGGVYPNRGFSSGAGGFAVREGLPLLVTRNAAAADRRLRSSTELTHWTRHEVRIGMSLAMSSRFHGAPVFSRDVAIVDDRLCEGLRWDRKVDFAVAFSRLAFGTRIGPPDSEPPVDWVDARLVEADMRRFARRFLVSHQVLLRTSLHYLKAHMLWGQFGEEALSSLLFALEGSLLLLQEVHGGRTDRVDREALRKIFDQLFEKGSVGMFNVLDEFRARGQHRARLVHPELATQYGWAPPLLADDFLETVGLVKSFIMIAVVGSSLPEWPLVNQGSRDV